MTIREDILDQAVACEGNGLNYEELISEYFNCETASLEESGDVWIEGPQQGHWLREDALATLHAYIEGLNQ